MNINSQFLADCSDDIDLACRLRVEFASGACALRFSWPSGLG
jgi:hypothetical protein